MKNTILKEQRRQRRKRRIGKKVRGTAEKPRLTVFRSNKNVYAQIIDDNAGGTLASSSSRDSGLSIANGGNLSAAEAVGADLATKAVALGVKQIAFDRNGYLYHGRVRSLADAARKGGLEF